MSVCCYCGQQQSLRWLPFCGRPADDVRLCPACWAAFAPITGTVCYWCGRPQAVAGACYDCERRQRTTRSLRVRAGYAYNAAMRDFMWRYKKVGDYRLRHLFRRPLAQLVATQAAAALPIPIPTRRSAQEARGFQPVNGLFDRCRLQDWLAVQDTYQATQSRQGRQQRLQRVQPFLYCGPPGAVAGREVVLVDDVYTTGTTLHQAADVLYAAGARRVTGIVLAR